MSGPVLRLYSVVERDPDPLSIPERPDIQCHQIRGNGYRYQIWHRNHGHVGYLHWREDGSFRARTFGSASDAAGMRLFDSQKKAVAWLETQFHGEND